MEGERYTASLSQKSKTALLPRDEKSDRYFSNPDKGPEGDWAGKDPVAREYRKNTVFGIQSPFTGTLHYPEAEYRFDGKIPEAAKHWRLNGMTKKQIKGCLDEWGTPYKEADLGDGCGEALVLAGSSIALKGYKPEKDPVVERSPAPRPS
jgi:adenine-specific DNA-methyltransferase